ncbi:MAG: YgiQ family radical SAM protein, partial [Ruminococcus sp.]|nr:YgiQ family radical SAM protein [Ruminococcus sp.]
MSYLPMTIEEVNNRGWDSVDFVYISGDSYVDHPSFGMAIITRVLESEGYRVAVLSQPDWRSERDFTQFGRPRLGFFISAGNIDSMVAHYTVAKRKRSDDAYTAGGRSGKRPDRAVTVYSNIVKRLYPDCPVIIGGLEASL